jgi:hypothetical protein
MLTLEQRMHMYQGKKLFIDHVSKVFEDEYLQSNVKKVEYEVYERVSKMDGESIYYSEFVVVTFVSGSISVRNISGNSNNASFREIGKLIDGGYYDEVEYYEKVKESGKLLEV